MDISVIIVNWNVRDLLRRCLASIEKYRGILSVESIVVDNASTDGSASMVQKEFTGVKLFRMPKNLGFARANNRALAKAQGRYLFFLNPDAELTPGALEALVAYMDAHPEVAVAAPRIENPDGTYQRGSIRREPTLSSQLLIILKLSHLLPRVHALQRYYYADFDPAREQMVDQVMGSAMFFRRSALDTVGYFDEKFFLWFEEVDLCRRVRQSGAAICYLPQARVIHHGGASFRQEVLITKQLIWYRSVVHYFYKHFGWRHAVVLWFASRVALLMVILYRPYAKRSADR